MTESSCVHVARWLSYQRLENGVRFAVQSDAGDSGQVEVTLVGPVTARVRMAPGILGPADQRLLVDQQGSVVGSTLSVDEQGLTLSTPQLGVRVNKEPWQLRLTDPLGETVTERCVLFKRTV